MHMHKRYVLFIVAFLTAIAGAVRAADESPALFGPTVISSERNDVSPALRDTEPIPPSPGDTVKIIPLRRLPRAREPKAPEDRLPDPVIQDWHGPSSMPAPIHNFDGVRNVDRFLPPDPNGDVGPNHYVQWVNVSFAIYDKTGTRLFGPANGNTLWAGFGGPCETTNSGDPIVLYDHLANRWLMSQFALPNIDSNSGPFFQCVAVSTTPDPTGSYFRYEFKISETKLNDYPKFGVWPDAYYMSINQFTAPSFGYGGAAAVAFERDNMLLGAPARMVYFDLESVNPNFFGLLPSDLDGPPPPANTPNYFVQVDDGSRLPPSHALHMWRFHVDWTIPSNSTFGVSGQPNAVVPTAPFDLDMCGFAPSCIPQRGTAARVHAISDQLMYRLQYRNFGTHESLLANHTVDVNGRDRAGIRWYEIRDPGGAPFIHQQGTYSPDFRHRWMGSIAMDGAGNIALGFSISSSRMFPSIAYVGRLVNDLPGTLPQGETRLIAGRGSQTSSASRWGDYSMMAVDPTDDCTFWYTQEYYRTTSEVGWRTRIGSFRLPSCQ